MITKDAKCEREIKCRISMSNATLNKNKILFASELNLKISKKLVKG
jgi:hypothetical protein